MIYILACFGVVALLGFIASAYFMRYRYDEYNPFRRYCVICGQQQDRDGHWGHPCWSTVGRVRNADCHCHADVRP